MHVGNISNHFDAMHHCLAARRAPRTMRRTSAPSCPRSGPTRRNVVSYVWLLNPGPGQRLHFRVHRHRRLPRRQARPDVHRQSQQPSRHAGFPGPGGPVRSGRCRPHGGPPAVAGQAESPTRAGSGNRVSQDWEDLQRRAFELVNGPGGRQVFELEREPANLRDRYGRHPLGQHLLLARRLVEAGVSCVTVTGWTGPSPEGGGGSSGISSWDMHGGHMGMGNAFGDGSYGMGWCLPRLDEALSALLTDLQERGLLERTLVVVVGEFGRSPRINTPGAPGRLHWPDCFSALLAGGGIRGGTVYGAVRQDRRLREGQAGASPGPGRHHLPRPRRAARFPPRPGRWHPASHHHRPADHGAARVRARCSRRLRLSARFLMGSTSRDSANAKPQAANDDHVCPSTLIHQGGGCHDPTSYLPSHRVGPGAGGQAPRCTPRRRHASRAWTILVPS